MITSFADKETAKIAAGEVSKKLPRDIQQAASKKLRILEATVRIEDLWQIPSLKAKRIGAQWSIRINDQWRICFQWNAERQEASKVYITDYH